MLAVGESTSDGIGVPENCAEVVGSPDLLGLAEIVWRLEPVSENCAEVEIV